MSVFDSIPRESEDPPHQDETAFAYLNRSGRIEAGRVRELVDDWFDRYPVIHRDALVARFRSPIDDHHKSAFFELFLHQLVLANGHRVVAIEPVLTHTSKSPDFLVESPNLDRYYLEAVLATGRSQADTAAHARLNQALAAIDKLDSPGDFLDLRVRGAPTAPLSLRTLRRGVLTWIASLPTDGGARDSIPFVHNEHGVRIELRAFPKYNPERRTRAIGVRHFGMQQIAPNEDIRTAVEKKSSRYGALDFPFVVAVNAFGLFVGGDHAFDALLGTPCIVDQQLADGSFRTQEIRNPDGVWWGPKGPRKTRLSAVLSTEGVTPWNLASRRARLIRNPWADITLPGVSLGVDEINPIGGKWHKTEGGALGKLFNLPAGWPGN